MKSLTKKAILLTSAIAVAGALAVCAAAPTMTITGVTPRLDGTVQKVDVAFTTSLTGVDQATVLAYQPVYKDVSGVQTEQPIADTKIVFIDQNTPNAIGTAGVITFTMRDGFADGNYKVLMGGTGIAQAAKFDFSIATAPVGKTITGTVGPVRYLGDPAGDPLTTQLNTTYETKVALLDSNGIELKKITLDSSVYDPNAAKPVETTNFTFDGVADGAYMLSFSRGGLCTKFVNVTVAGTNVTLEPVKLLGSDTDSLDPFDSSITGLDVAQVFSEAQGVNRSIFNADFTAINPNFNVRCDADGNMEISGLDVSATIAAALATGYQPW